MATVQEKVEKWIAEAPKEVKFINADVSKAFSTNMVFGRITPIVQDSGYDIAIYLHSDDWE